MEISLKCVEQPFDGFLYRIVLVQVGFSHRIASSDRWLCSAHRTQEIKSRSLDPTLQRQGSRFWGESGRETPFHCSPTELWSNRQYQPRDPTCDFHLRRSPCRQTRHRQSALVQYQLEGFAWEFRHHTSSGCNAQHHHR